MAGRRLTGYALVLPAFLVVFAMLIYPLLYDAVESFIGAEDFNTGGPFVGLANYARAFSDPLYWEAVRNTVVHISSAMLISRLHVISRVIGSKRSAAIAARSVRSGLRTED